MTALSEYDRLETTGLWRETPEDHKREVIVSFGNATLVLKDKAERALTHWSLPAISRRNPGEYPAIYSPDVEGGETLELDETFAIEAIERVLKVIDRRRPQPGRLRLVLTTSILAAFTGLMVFWLPNAMVEYATSITPQAQRTKIGDDLFQQIRRVSGHPCTQPQASNALSKMAQHLGAERNKLVVVRTGVETSVNLPGGYIILNRRLVEDFEDPNSVSGYVLAELERAKNNDPLYELLQDLGVRGTFRFLTSGQISIPALTRHAEKLLAQPLAPVDPEPLLARFEAANLPSTPYAYSVDISGETTLPLIEADPIPQEASDAIITDGEWVALQEICQS
ncbi:hypothetical protein [Falsihalocynthiibacter arcticus]|uniref:Peptidase M48 domain-containing protein n=1 Tax=Falsihalocynthiibacter arcticus TaxID=1579316 RepID=A0A126UWX0_9RHOB|nr:hypothetical protein [Falsihalocynthiibacter arcticus]AML50225.1 hypothetical protein RC74_02140 [Falsihalocynthiibacter arcticus]